MAGFIRRFTEFPGSEVLTQIEGVNIIDLPPPGSIEGRANGVVCLVGEFADMTYAVAIDEDTGAITSDPTAIDIVSAQDLLDKLGGFDETIGEFGVSMGNGFVELRNKRFSRLVAVPVNLCSDTGIRLWRDLPTNKTATDPTPVVPVRAGVVSAGREFRDGVDRVRTGARVVFSDEIAFVTGVDGDVTATAPAATQTFTSAGSTFVADEVKEGDILVVGVIGGAGALGSNADTYRVVSVTSETALVVEKMDGASFDWVTGSALPFRIHKWYVADTGGEHQLSEAAGYLVPARPLTDGAGTGSSAADGTWAASTALAPLVVPPAADASSADPLSGLAGQVTTDAGGLDFTAAVQAPNAVSSATIDALYDTAIDALLSDVEPARDVNHVWSARKSSTIASKLRSHCLDASGNGIGRTCSISPALTQLTLATISGAAAPGVGATRAERAFYNWPGLRTFVPEAVNTLIKTSDGKTTEDGVLDTTSDGWAAAVISNLAPERNPGEASASVRRVMSPVLGFARGTPNLVLGDYILLRQRGVMAPRIDRSAGPIFQSGITSSLTAGEKNVNRRRMADFIEDSWAERMVQLAKLPMSESLKDTILTETEEFLADLLSADNPAAQRIAEYQVDGVSGNTPQLEAKGIFIVIIRVRTLATADFITLQAEIGEGVVIQQAA